MDSNTLAVVLACTAAGGAFLGVVSSMLTRYYSFPFGPALKRKNLIYIGLVLFFCSCYIGTIVNGAGIAYGITLSLCFILVYALCSRGAL